MNINEAYNILGLSKGATEEQINTAFKKLAREHHPDRNKDNIKESEEKFKRINEAAQLLKKEVNRPTFNSFNRQNVRANPNPEFFVNIMKNQFIYESVRNRQAPLKVFVNLTFAESILGCQKNIEYSRLFKCLECSGKGSKPNKDAKCDTCKGRSNINRSRGGFEYSVSCEDCDGTGEKLDECEICNGTGSNPKSEKFTVNVPPGAMNNQTIKISGVGNYVCSFNRIMMNSNMQVDNESDIYSDIFLIAQVERDPEMTFDGTNVISHLNLTLLEAIKGTSKKVRTIKGEMNLKIAAKIKHNNQIQAAGYGVGGIGNHLFIVNVEYPEDSTQLIEYLENEMKG